MTNQTNQTKQFQGECWKCGHFGHRAFECRSGGLLELTDGKLMPEGQAGADAGFMAEEVEKTVTQQMYPEVSGPVWQVGQMQKLKSGVQIYEVFGFVDGRLKAVGQILPGFSLPLVDSGSFVNTVLKILHHGIL